MTVWPQGSSCIWTTGVLDEDVFDILTFFKADRWMELRSVVVFTSQVLKRSFEKDLIHSLAEPLSSFKALSTWMAVLKSMRHSFLTYYVNIASEQRRQEPWGVSMIVCFDPRHCMQEILRGCEDLNKRPFICSLFSEVTPKRFAVPHSHPKRGRGEL